MLSYHCAMEANYYNFVWGLSRNLIWALKKIRKFTLGQPQQPCNCSNATMHVRDNTCLWNHLQLWSFIREILTMINITLMSEIFVFTHQKKKRFWSQLKTCDISNFFFKTLNTQKKLDLPWVGPWIPRLQPCSWMQPPPRRHMFVTSSS